MAPVAISFIGEGCASRETLTSEAWHRRWSRLDDSSHRGGFRAIATSTGDASNEERSVSTGLIRPVVGTTATDAIAALGFLG
ncbi:hypothetical protein V6N12_044892 [Hibiscus sabdariffa]|uniref:Uncharacterized protein n=1 Tax=Hibiscus sabdariffa TaxID=183260 RepID=A0ABR2AX10_9ROSI